MNIPSCRRPAWAAFLLSALGVLAALPATAAERGPVARSRAAPAETEARVIVKFKADSNLMRALSAQQLATTGPQHAAALSGRLGLVLNDGRAIGPHTQVLKAAGLTSAELAAQLSAQADVEYAVVDGRMHALDANVNDPLYLNTAGTQTPASGQWYMQAPSATLVSAINVPAAWAITNGASSLVVADLDTGIRSDHPDLVNKLVAGRNFASTNGVSQTGWSADPSDPGDFAAAGDCGTGTPAHNSSWHGTQTAGLIGAQTNNGIGMASVGHDVVIQPLRVLGKCGGFNSDIQAAMRWAGGLSVPGLSLNPTPARVLNMSLGGTGACDSGYQDVVTQLLAVNVVVVVAAGNEGVALDSPSNCTGVIAVVGVRHAGTKVGYSNLGPTATISAPAGNCVNTSGTCVYPILTTSNKGTTTPTAGAAGAIYTGGDGDESLGTSFSAPIVSGTIALMLSANPSLTPAQIVSALRNTARAFPSTGAGTGVTACVAPSTVAQGDECYCTTSTCGAGLLDAGAAVSAAAAAVARIGVASTSVVAGNTVTLDGSGSSSGGGTIVGYDWSITTGGSIASFTSATNASTATLATSAAGAVVVNLTVTDNTGRQASAAVTISVSAVPTPPPPSSGGGGGGGAMELGWLLGWLASVLGVRVVTPRPRRCAD